MSQGAAIRAGRAFVEFFIEDGRLDRGLKTIERKLQYFGRRMQNLSRNALAWGLAASVALAFPLKGFADFDDQIKQLESLATRGAVSLAELREQAKRLGRDTSFTAIDVAGGMTEQARAGFDTDQIAVSTAPLMNLARATQTELPRAVEIGVGTLRAFKLEAEEMERVVNVAVATVNKSAIGMEDYAESMKYAAPAAALMGQSLEETSKQIGVLGNLQIKGSLAGTAIRNALMRIADPQIRQQIEKFTPVIDPVTGKIKDLSRIMQELGTATAGEDAASRMNRLALMTEMFGLRSAGAAIVLSENIAEGFDEAFSDPKFAENVAKHMDSGIGGALRRLQSMWEGVTITFGEATESMLSNGMEAMTSFLGVVQKLIEKNPQLARGLILIVGGAVALGLAGNVAAFLLRGLGFAVGTLARVLNVAAMAGRLAWSGVMLLVKGLILAGPVAGGLIGALMALVGWFVYTSGAAQRMGAFLKDTFADALGTIGKLIMAGELNAAMDLAWALLQTTWTIGTSALKEKWAELTGGLSGFLLEGVAGAELIWLDFTDYLVDTFQRAMGALLDGWISLTNDLSTFIAPMIAKITGQDEAEVLATLKEDQEREAAIRGKPYAEMAEDRVAERAKAREKKREQIGANLNDALKENDAITQGNVSAAQREANAARANYDQARARAGAILDPKEINAPAEDEKKRQEELRNLLSGGLNFASGERKTTEAVAVKSKEGQEAIAKALGFGGGDADKVRDAILEMQGAVVNQLEDLNENMEESNSNLGAW